MRMRLFNHLEAHVGLKRPDETQRFKFMRIDEVPDPSPSVRVLQRIDYRATIGARCNVPPGGEAHARDRVVRMLAREIVGDLTEELVNLSDWAFRQGYNDELIRRIDRLIELSQGREVDDV